MMLVIVVSVQDYPSVHSFRMFCELRYLQYTYRNLTKVEGATENGCDIRRPAPQVAPYAKLAEMFSRGFWATGCWLNSDRADDYSIATEATALIATAPRGAVASRSAKVTASSALTAFVCLFMFFMINHLFNALEGLWEHD